MQDNPGISLNEALNAQVGLRNDQLGIFGGMLDNFSDFGSQVFGNNPIANFAGAMLGFPIGLDADKLGISDYLSKWIEEDEKSKQTKAPTRPEVPDHFKHLTPEQLAAIGRFGGGRGMY